MPEIKPASFLTRAGSASLVAGGAIVILTALYTVSLAAASALVISYLFPQTFTAFMALIGLGKYELWQLAAVLAYVAFLLKPFRRT